LTRSHLALNGLWAESVLARVGKTPELEDNMREKYNNDDDLLVTKFYKRLRETAWWQMVAEMQQIKHHE
jgi:hypothetical protein